MQIEHTFTILNRPSIIFPRELLSMEYLFWSNLIKYHTRKIQHFLRCLLLICSECHMWQNSFTQISMLPFSKRTIICYTQMRMHKCRIKCTEIFWATFVQLLNNSHNKSIILIQRYTLGSSKRETDKKCVSQWHYSSIENLKINFLSLGHATSKCHLELSWNTTHPRFYETHKLTSSRQQMTVRASLSAKFISQIKLNYEHTNCNISFTLSYTLYLFAETHWNCFRYFDHCFSEFHDLGCCYKCETHAQNYATEAVTNSAGFGSGNSMAKWIFGLTNCSAGFVRFVYQELVVWIFR